jgi:uncharacterized membrane protein
MSFVKFMSSGAGRLLRVVAGAVLVVVGVALGGGWLVLSVVGLVPLFAGAANVCVFAPLMGQPLKGR